MAEQVFVGAIGADLNTAADLIRVPVVRSCTITEFGVFNFGGADAGDSDGALELFYHDGANNVTLLRTLLGTTAFDQGEILVGRTSVHIDTVGDRYVISGTATSEAQGITCVGVRVKSGAVFASSSTGQAYLVIDWKGSPGDAATGTLQIAPTA